VVEGSKPVTKTYENPPVIEALCEFQFDPIQPWDWTIPGLVYDKVKNHFPKKRQANVLNVELEPQEKGVAQRVKGGVARMQFLREDETALIQVGPDLLVVNQLKPYPAWVVFKKLILDSLQTYWDIVHPRGFRRIELRYINRIETSEGSVDLDRYFTVAPKVPDPVPQTFLSFIIRTEIPFENEEGLLILAFGSALPEMPVKRAFILDLDFITVRPEQLDLTTAMDWVERAHTQIEKTFEACITDETRRLFTEATL
jgi:uncharacterized protein (TIGR04255 family)